MAIKQIDIVYVHALEALVDTRHKILTRAPLSIRSRPHIVTSFGRYEQFIAVALEVIVHESAHSFFCRTVWRSIVVGKIEMGDTMVESVVSDGTTALIRVVASEIMPES